MTKKEKEDYENLCELRRRGMILTPDVLQLICEAMNYNFEAVGRYFVELNTYLKSKK